MKEFKQLVLGDLSIPYYMAAALLCFLAILVSMYAGSKRRDQSSESTPFCFSWWFLIWDNTKRIVVGMIVMFFFFRFASAAIGRALSMEVAVGIGFFLSIGLDQAIGFLKQKFDLLQMNREKFKQ